MSQSWCSAVLAGKRNGHTKWLIFLLHHLNVTAPLLICLSNITVRNRFQWQFLRNSDILVIKASSGCWKTSSEDRCFS